MRAFIGLLFWCLAFSISVRADSLVFVTSTLFDGNLGGLTGADSKCQALAQNVRLPGTFRAFLGATNTNAGDRIIHSTAAYRLVNGDLVANNWTALTSQTLAHAINLDERGNDVSQTAQTKVWTATNADFTYYGVNCNTVGTGGGWNATNSRTMTGSAVATSPSWVTGGGVQPCATPLHLYCIQQVANLAYISGRVTQTSGRPVTHAMITITSSSLPGPVTVYTDRDGYYISSGLPSGGRYTISPSHRRFNPPFAITLDIGDGGGTASWTVTQR